MVLDTRPETGILHGAGGADTTMSKHITKE
ncbi:MAG: hypothetical protein A4E63_02948 [Syntrophorhabdus sp. PtaU1.Bin050]|nr:MAG: hypothetical protein A4E63_02948 [Syntrophorhabdus sp. PtaU1.Bin050]